MTTKHCKTCKHWKEDNDDVLANPYDPDTYQRMVMPFEVRRCGQPLLLFCERPVVSNGACVKDASEYWAALYTAEDFGCVNWKERKA